MVAYACDPSTEEAEAGGSQLQVQTGLYSKTLSQNNKRSGQILDIFEGRDNMDSTIV
jgi:hypothetical protein